MVGAGAAAAAVAASPGSPDSPRMAIATGGAAIVLSWAAHAVKYDSGGLGGGGCCCCGGGGGEDVSSMLKSIIESKMNLCFKGNLNFFKVRDVE